MKQSVVRTLYASSGGKCALCKVDVIRTKSDGSPYHTSEIAHIRGKKPKALRHDSTISDEGMDDISNLIILCPNCHTEIDKNDTDYTVERLYYLKEEHENWVRIQLGRETSDGFQVDLIDCVHIEENEHLIHHIDLSLSNKTKTTMRIIDISLFNDTGKKLEFVSRGQTSTPETKFELRGKESYSWQCFCKNKPDTENELSNLNILIGRIGKREFGKKITSMRVDRGDFPSGDFFRVIDW